MALPLSITTQDQVLAAQIRNVLTNGGAWTNVVALTATTGTTGNTISDVTATPTQTLVNNNFKVLADKINELIVLVNRVNA
jgi:hypothetical protein